MKKTLISLLVASAFVGGTAIANEYKIDKQGQHAFIQFKISHLGYSWLLGEFTNFDGRFFYDPENSEKNNVSIDIDVTSVDSNHAERDKHLRGADFFDVKKYPTATFKSTSFSDDGDGIYTLVGDLTLKGVKKEISLDVLKVGEGKDPWGGYRAGFEGRTTFNLSDFNMDKALGDQPVEIYISIEGIRQ